MPKELVGRRARHGWLLLSWSLCLLSGLSHGSGLRAQTLEEALVSTYLSNPTLKAQRATLRSATEAVAEAKGGWRPTLAIEGDLQANTVDDSSDSGRFTSSSAALVLEQNLYRGGETVASVSQAEYLLLYERAHLLVTEQEVILTAIDAYTGVVNALAVLDLAKANEKRLAKQLDATRKRFKAGEFTGTDVSQAEARFAGAIAERDRALSAVEAAKALYRSVTDQDPVSLSPPTAPDLTAAGETEAQSLASEGNPAIQAARYRLAATGADIRIAEAALYPSLDLQAEVSYADDPSLDTSYERAAAVGVELRIPLYQGGGEYARIRRAKQEMGRFGDGLEAVKRAVAADTSQAWQDFRAARSNIGSIEQQVTAAKQALEGARKEAEVGQRTILDVLDLEDDLFRAEIALETARRDEVVAAYRLRLALGELTANALDLPGKRYDAELYDQNNRNRLIGIGR
ncbi:MAG: TolC family outer membrane protein [Geminicoccaceae bacterium]